MKPRTANIGDQDLTVTLQRFKEGWRAAASSPDDTTPAGAWWPTLAAELRSISEAVNGPKELPPSQKVRVVPLLFTQGRYLRELLKVLIPVGAIVGLSLHVMEGVSDAAVTLVGQLGLFPAATALFSTAVSDGTGGGLDAAATASAGAAGTVGWLNADTLTDLGWLSVNVVMLGWFLALNQVRVRACKDGCGFLSTGRPASLPIHIRSHPPTITVYADTGHPRAAGRLFGRLDRPGLPEAPGQARGGRGGLTALQRHRPPFARERL